MANRDEHDVLGLLFGAISAVAAAESKGRRVRPAEVVGGAIGGLIGSRLPDVVEPATSPRHRKFAHSVTTLSVTSAVGVPAAARFQNKVAEAAQAEQDPVLRFLAELGGGATTGLATGYASHLLADATTPMGLPLLG